MLRTLLGRRNAGDLANTVLLAPRQGVSGRVCLLYESLRRLQRKHPLLYIKGVLRERHWPMVALVYRCLIQPLLQRGESAHRCTHSHDLEPIRLFKDLLNRPQFGDDALQLVAPLLILNQVKLVYDEEFYFEVLLLLDELVEQPVRFLDGADSEVHA